MGRTRGVKNYRETGTGIGKLDNWETGNQEIGDPVLVPVWKIQKPGTLVPVPGFYQVTKNRVFILFNNIYILLFFTIRFRHFHFCSSYYVIIIGFRHFLFTITL
jgi:hypothetical protein